MDSSILSRCLANLRRFPCFSSLSVCLDFSRCPPCKAIAPVFEALAREHPGVVFLKVDVDKTPSIKRILGVWAMPTFFFVREGNKLGSVMGANEGALRRGIANDGNVGVCATVASSCSIQ